jgi:hypothetical protein
MSEVKLIEDVNRPGIYHVTGLNNGGSISLSGVLDSLEKTSAMIEARLLKAKHNPERLMHLKEKMAPVKGKSKTGAGKH